MSAPNEQLQEARSYLLRYATLQLRDPALAEDVVQETLLAALDGPSGFSGKSAYKTWLVGILKHKIIDAIRRRSRELPLGTGDPDSESEPADELFEATGHWQRFPSDWGSPEKSLEDRRFWEVFERCLQVMPERTARVFMMREVMELESDDICKELSITQTNLWVMLHRARLSLRGCLETKWFGKGAK